MVKLLWNIYARCYEHITKLLPYQEMLDDVVAALDIKPGMRILDAGCGTGVLARRLADKCPDIVYRGVDQSSRSIRPVERICRSGCGWRTVAPEVTDGREEGREPWH